jgi:hypothetical protein
VELGGFPPKAKLSPENTPARNPYSLLTTNFVDQVTSASFSEDAQQNSDSSTNDLQVPDNFGDIKHSFVDDSEFCVASSGRSAKLAKSNPLLHGDNLVCEKRSFADQCKEGRCGWRQKEYNNKIDVLIRNNYKKCIQWCVNHNISYNEFEN